MFVFAFIYARVLSKIDTVLFRRSVNPGFSLLIAAVVYINMFNLIRGGTSITTSIIMMVVISIVPFVLDRVRWK